jgi:penicillin-binding protein 1A
MPGSTMRMWKPQPREAPPPRQGSGGAPKRRRLPTATRKKWFTILTWAGIAAIAGLGILIGTVAFVFWMYGRDPNLPDIHKLSDYHPKVVTKVLDQNGHLIGELPAGSGGQVERRTFVDYDKIPPVVVDAFIAAEDHTFWTHGGVDYVGMFRAFLSNLRAGHTTQGASTITQQVVKNMLLTSERSFKRKIQEIILARRLEDALTKQEILTLYLNQINFGDKRFGIQEAARYYFGKDVAKLDAGEAAMLAAMPKEPEALADALLKNKNPQRAKQRQIYVLNRMVEAGKLAAADAQKFIDAPIHVVKDPFPYLNTAPEWVSLVQKELIAQKCAPKATCDEGVEYLDTLGATVRTTLDPQLQATAQKALQNGLRGVDKRQHIGRPVRNVKQEKLTDELKKLAKNLGGAPKKGEIYEAVVTSVADAQLDVDLGNYPARLALGDEADQRFNPDNKPAAERFKAGDVVQVIGAGDDKQSGVHRVTFAPGPQGAVVIIDVKTRKVRALVGGYSSRVAGLNRATDAHRQPGSSFKPFVYATAMQAGKDGLRDEGGKLIYTPASEVIDSPERIEKWMAKNYETGKFEGPVLLRYALSKSINTVSIKLVERLGPDRVGDTAHKMGIHSQLPTTPAIALGAGEVTPLEMTNAVATIAAGGVFAEAKFVDAIDGKNTDAAKGEQVLPPEVAYVTASMMQSVVQSGTGFQASKLGIPIAGKTGTSNDARDVWFVGLTPDIAIGVWIGYDDPHAMPKETGGTTAVPVYVEIAKTMNLPGKQFPRPAHVVEARIDRASGLLAPEDAPKETTMTEVFVEGTAPTEYAAKPGDVTESNQVEREYD